MITPKIIAVVLFSAIAQAGVCLLPLTKGLTNLWPTVATMVCFFIGLGVMSRRVKSDVKYRFSIDMASLKSE